MKKLVFVFSILMACAISFSTVNAKVVTAKKATVTVVADDDFSGIDKDDDKKSKTECTKKKAECSKKTEACCKGKEKKACCSKAEKKGECTKKKAEEKK